MTSDEGMTTSERSGPKERCSGIRYLLFGVLSPFGFRRLSFSQSQSAFVRPVVIWKVGWRVGVGALLLFWIFHSIFLNEGRLAAKQELGLSWDSLSRTEQWKIGWTRGPAKLWATLCLVHPGALALSVALMGLTIV